MKFYNCLTSAQTFSYIIVHVQYMYMYVAVVLESSVCVCVYYNDIIGIFWDITILIDLCLHCPALYNSKSLLLRNTWPVVS